MLGFAYQPYPFPPLIALYCELQMRVANGSGRVKSGRSKGIDGLKFNPYLMQVTFNAGEPI